MKEDTIFKKLEQDTSKTSEQKTKIVNLVRLLKDKYSRTEIKSRGGKIWIRSIQEV